MIPSLLFFFFAILASSFCSVVGLVFDNNVLLLVATIMAPTADIIYSIIKSYIFKHKIGIIKFLLYIVISIFTPLCIGIFFGYIMEVIKNNNNDNEIVIPSPTMDEKIKKSDLNLFFTIIIPLILCLFLPYSIKTNNNSLIIAISIGLSFITPLTNIGLFIGSNKFTKKEYKLSDYTIPIVNFSSNIIFTSIISFIMIKYLKIT
jgi:hypothetical protein